MKAKEAVQRMLMAMFLCSWYVFSCCFFCFISFNGDRNKKHRLSQVLLLTAMPCNMSVAQERLQWHGALFIIPGSIG